MKIVKYISLINKLSKIEGQKEHLKGQQNLSAKHLMRGTIGEDEFVSKSQTVDHELRILSYQRRSAIRQYLAA